MKIKTTVVFEHLQKSEELGKRIVIEQGGSRSGKTYNTLIWWIQKLLQEEGKTLSIVRKTLPSLKNSVLKDLREVLELFGVYNPTDWHKQEGFYTLGTNTINWFSVDEPQKLRGSKRDYLYINESNELNMEDWNQLIFRTDGKVVMDLNPSELSCWVYELEERDDVYFFITTWRDNPFVSQTIIDELKSLQYKDENLWRIYDQGLKGISTTLVFNKFNTIENIPPQAKLMGRGIDFGYNDPTTLIEVYKDDDNLYLNEMIYSKGLTMVDLVHKIDSLGIPKTDELWCDSANPASIEELRRNRYNAKPVNKSSILVGLDLMRRHHLFITTKSKNILEEFQSYKWKQDRDGKMMDVPIDDYNHTIDAARYVCLMTINKKSTKITIV